MHSSGYEDYCDVPLPEDWQEILGKCGAFMGVDGPKVRPIINYGLPEHQAILAALWHFGTLPFFVQLCLIDEHTKRC